MRAMYERDIIISIAATPEQCDQQKETTVIHQHQYLVTIAFPLPLQSMEETVARILDKLVSLPTHPLHQDDTLSHHRARLISSCSELLRLLRQKASNLGKHDGSESRAALVLQHVVETMTTAPNDAKCQRASTGNNELRNSSYTEQRNNRPVYVFDRKCVPTIKDLASCINVKHSTLEALKKTLQYYLNITNSHHGANPSRRERNIVLTSHAQPRTNPPDNVVNASIQKANGSSSSSTDSFAQFIQQLSIRLTSMLDFDYNAQRVVAGAAKLYKNLTRFKLQESKGAKYRRSATKFDFEKYHEYYCASCFYITVSGMCFGNKASSNSATTSKKGKGQDKERVQQLQQHILNITKLLPDLFQGILGYVHSVVLEIKQQEEQEAKRKRQEGDQHQKRPALNQNSTRKRQQEEQQQTKKSRNSDSVDSFLIVSRNVVLEIEEETHRNPVTFSKHNDAQKDCSNNCRLDFLWGRENSTKVRTMCGSLGFHRWKDNVIELYIDAAAMKDCNSDMPGEDGPCSLANVATASVESQDNEEKKRRRRLKELAANNFLKEYGLL